MELLLSSSRTPGGYLTDYLPEIEDFSAGTRRAVFVPFAAVAVPWAEYARANPQVPVIGLPEGDGLRVSGSSIELRGAHAAVWFHGEKAPARIQPGTPTPSGDSL